MGRGRNCWRCQQPQRPARYMLADVGSSVHVVRRGERCVFSETWNSEGYPGTQAVGRPRTPVTRLPPATSSPQLYICVLPFSGRPKGSAPMLPFVLALVSHLPPSTRQMACELCSPPCACPPCTAARLAVAASADFAQCRGQHLCVTRRHLLHKPQGHRVLRGGTCLQGRRMQRLRAG